MLTSTIHLLVLRKCNGKYAERIAVLIHFLDKLLELD